MLIYYILSIVFVGITYFIGRSIENRHYQEIRKQELEFARIPAVTIPYLPKSWGMSPEFTLRNRPSSIVVTGSVMISQDYFKSIASLLKSVIGGRLYSYETLLDRARREAVLRMKRDARTKGYNTIIGVRFETSTIASNSSKTTGVEVMVYGTALRVNQNIS
jgi:uncharacterized protein YbjQ (UPF0145 family)